LSGVAQLRARIASAANDGAAAPHDLEQRSTSAESGSENTCADSNDGVRFFMTEYLTELNAIIK